MRTLPAANPQTAAPGIHQSDVIIRSAIKMALDDLRVNSWLLNYVFASLPQDSHTAHIYGEKEAAKARQWFLATDIPVVMDYRVGDPESNCISISLVDSTEAEATLGDVHHTPTELTESAWGALTPTFNPVAYDHVTGILTLPDEIGAALVPVPGMVVISATGHQHPITSVIDRTSVVLSPGLSADFRGAVIKGSEPSMVAQLESLSYRETYRIGVHAHGEPVKLTWLHSIVVFVLLRYKQTLLEARGFERNTMSSAPFAKNESFGRENYWTRFVSLTGYVRHHWPKDVSNRIGGVQTGIKVSPVGFEAITFSSPEEEAAWLASDGVGLRKI